MLDAGVVDEDVEPAERSTAAAQIARGVALDVADRARRGRRAVEQRLERRRVARACATTDAPASCSRRAIPAPMFPLAPVTSATRPVRSSRRRPGAGRGHGGDPTGSVARHRPDGDTPDRALRHDAAAGRGNVLRRRPTRARRRPRPGGPAGTAGVGLFCDDPPSRSLFHRLAFDEVWHFYAGDPLRLVLLHPDGSDEEVVLGGDVLAGGASSTSFRPASGRRASSSPGGQVGALRLHDGARVHAGVLRGRACRRAAADASGARAPTSSASRSRTASRSAMPG